MPLPANFNGWEHLQTVLNQVQNRIVRAEFKDVGDDSWESDITTPRGSLRVACTLVDNDSAIMALIRLWLFYIILRKAKDLQADIYGIPITSYQEVRKFKPQIMLYFQEDFDDIEPGYSPVTGEISFRVMDEEGHTLTKAKLTTLANKIKQAFATPSFVWKKGKFMITYFDKPKGYQLQLLCRSEAEGKRVIEQVLDIQSHTPDWQFMNVSENQEPTQAYPTIPRNEMIYGKTRRLPRKRPIADVRFQYAVAHIWGIPKGICLVDRSGSFSEPLINLAA